jgi:hypothetical protein
MDISGKIIMVLVVIMVVIIIGHPLVSIIFSATTTAVNSTTNIIYQTLLNIVPLIFIASIIIGSVALFKVHRD